MTCRKRLAAAAAWLLLGAACTQQMADQPRYEPYEASGHPRDPLSARAVPEGAIPYRALDDALPSEANPFPVDMQLLERGRQRYDVYCAPCHDYTGSGRGMIAIRGFRQMPRTFHSDAMRAASDAYFYDIATNGFGLMPSYAFQVRSRDRWAIVAYIRALQLSQWAAVDSVGDADRDEIGRLP